MPVANVQLLQVNPRVLKMPVIYAPSEFVKIFWLKCQFDMLYVTVSCVRKRYLCDS